MHYGTLLRHFFRSHRDQCSAMDGGYIVNAFNRTCSINTKAAIRAPQAATADMRHRLLPTNAMPSMHPSINNLRVEAIDKGSVLVSEPL